MFDASAKVDGHTGGQHRDRALRAAQQAYLAAVRRLNDALIAYDQAGIPLNPGPDDSNPRPWTRQQIQIIVAVGPALMDCIDRRRAWERIRRGTPGPQHHGAGRCHGYPAGQSR